MAELKLKANQAALILEASEEGEISVNVASPETESETTNFVSDLCSVIAQKLINDEEFQAEILSELHDEKIDEDSA
jgi:hypothetical protein